MKSIKIAGKKFRLAPRAARLYALFIDVAVLGTVQFGFAALLSALAFFFIRENPFNFGRFSVISMGLSLFGMFFSLALWIFGLFFMDGFRRGQGIGKRLLSLQVVRLKDGEPCSFKDSFVRRCAGLFQPFDALWSLGKKRQRLGDRFAETVVVKYDPDLMTQPDEAEKESPEQVLEAVIVEMKSRLEEAQKKVDASIKVEKQFRTAYDTALSEAAEWHERAVIALKVGHEDMARQELERRNEYRQLAEQHKKQWEEQQQTVRALKALLEQLRQKMLEAEQKKTILVAKQRNVDAEAHLREMLTEIQDSNTFETLEKMEQDTAEAATLAKTAAEMDFSYQNEKREREFSSYAEEAALDKELADLKAKLR